MAIEKLQIDAQPMQSVSLGDGGAGNRVRRINEMGKAVDELRAAVAPMAQRENAAASETAGREAALAGEFRPRRDSAFGAAEFNRAGMNTVLSELEITMRQHVDKVFEENKHDPAALNVKYDTYRQELEAQLGGDDMRDVLPQFRAMYERATLPRKQSAADSYERTLLATNGAKAMQLLETRMNDAERFARTQDIDPKAQQALLDEAQAFDRVMIEHGPKEGFSFQGQDYPPDPTRSGNFSPTDMEKLSTRWVEQMEESAIMGGFDRSTNKEGYVAAFEKRERGRKGSPFSLDQVDALAGRMQTEINKDRARSDLYKTALGKQIADAEKVFEAGKTPVGILSLRKAAEPFPELVAQIDAAEQDSMQSANFAQLTPDNQQAVINTLAGRKLSTARQVQLETRFERIKNETQSLLDKDPVTLLSKAQIMDVTPIDLSNPATFANRADEAGMLRSYYGKEHHGLTEAEVTGISTLLDSQTSDANAAYLAGIRSGMDDRRLLSLMTELAPKNPEFAAAAGVAIDRPDISADILRGVDVLKVNTGMLPAQADVATLSDEYFGDAITGTNRAMIEKAALALDAARRDKSGISSKDEFDPSGFKQALEDVTGGVYRWHGKKIISPVRGMDADTFADVMDTFTQADIAGMHNGMFGVRIEDFKRNATLQSLEDGRYLVMIADGFATDATGKPFELNLKAKLPELQKRVRTTFMGVDVGAQ